MQSIKVRDGFGSRRFKRIIIFSTITTKSRCTGLISTLIEKFFRNFLSLFFLFPLFHPGWQLSYTEKPISMLSISVLPQKFLLLVNPIQKSHGYVGGNLLSFKNKFFSFIMAFSFRLSVLRSSILMLVTLLFVAIIETERFFIRQGKRHRILSNILSSFFLRSHQSLKQIGILYCFGNFFGFELISPRFLLLIFNLFNHFPHSSSHNTIAILLPILFSLIEFIRTRYGQFRSTKPLFILLIIGQCAISLFEHDLIEIIHSLF